MTDSDRGRWAPGSEQAAPESGFRTSAEQEAGPRLGQIFHSCPDTLEIKLDSFPKYVRRQALTRLLALYEIFRLVLPIKGSVIDCGVYRGFSLMTFAHLSSILEPVNLSRRVYGFDTFEGFASISYQDESTRFQPQPGMLRSDSLHELMGIINVFDSNRMLGHISKVSLIKGDAVEAIPRFLEQNPHLVVSLLYLDFDLYEPTKVAIDSFVPRMPKGAVIAFDELDNPIWPGETQALVDTLGIGRLKIERIPFDPYIGYAILD